ncbi:type III PLP-dependent enzyme [Woodsholea maritima]|uniref:type III PLP-dependent enzyme n=1 Tax=Woodsholea maritima TaxID=240237 RepID=UPI001F1F1821|nr:type III PLP-dependent enzyme [Woodsholea maritima]
MAVASRWFQDHFPGHVLFAVKANPSAWVIDGLYQSGLRWFDVASLPEIQLISQRCPAATMAFMHPVKAREAIHRAYFEFGVRIFAFDCEEELAKIVEETCYAQDLTLVARLAVSNDGATLPLAGKFGANVFQAPELIRKARSYAQKLGVSFHVGSQCMSPNAYRMAMRDCSNMIVRAAVTVDIVDVGGGFPTIYPGLVPPPMQDYITAICEAFETMMVLENAELWCEPGRALVAEAASVLTRVELRKGNQIHLNDGAFGCLYDAVYAKWPFPVRVHRKSGEASTQTQSYQLFGPTCDSMDTWPYEVELPVDLQEGDVLEFGNLGSYGETMATRFNGFGQVQHARVQDMPFPSVFSESAEAVGVGQRT